MRESDPGSAMAEHEDDNRRRLERIAASEATAPLASLPPSLAGNRSGSGPGAGAGSSSGAGAGSAPASSSSSTSAPGQASCPNFGIGELIAGRYKILRLIGEGGMGEVYEAEDLLLRERVALKTIRQASARDEKVVERFKREIQLARKVTHPNVCRIFDVGLHRPPAGKVDIAFLTMELLVGETLAARIQRAGRMSTSEALPLVQQMAHALGAAHRAGVVHRDFKSANVILVPEHDGDGLRAVVTDFGLACARAPQGTEASSLTGDGGVIGSPAYMAPEQVEGAPVTAATDVYALGVVLFEMTTGRLPFLADTPLATAVMRLREAAPSARKLAPELDERWDQAISRCLAREPGARFASPGELLGALGIDAGRSVPTAPVPRVGPASRPRRWSAAAVAGAVVVAAIVAMAAFRSSHGRRVRGRAEARTESSAVAAGQSVTGRRSVAVLGFKNLTGRAEAASMSGALGEMISAELTATGSIRAVSGEAVARAKRELALADEDSFAPDTLQRIRHELDVDYVLVGSYMALPKESGGKIRFDMKLQDTRTGEIVATFSETGTEADLLDMVARTGSHLRDRLGLRAPSAVETQEIRAALPAKPEVAKLYAEGVAQLRVDACSAARGPLEQAVAADPGYALAHSALAEALNCLGLHDRALAEAKLAVDQAVGSPNVQKQALGLYYRMAHEPEKALETYVELFRQFPDDFDFGIQVGLLQARLHQGEALGATLVALRKLPGPARDNPRIELLEGMGQVIAGDPDEAMVHWQKARTKAESQGARLVAAEASLYRAAVGLQFEKVKEEEAFADLDQARATFEAAGDLDGISKLLSIEAYVRQKHGDEAAVRKIEDRVAGIASSLANPREMVDVKLAVAGARMEQDLSAAGQMLRDVVETARAVKAPGQLFNAQVMLALVNTLAGNLEGIESALADLRASPEAARLPEVALVVSQCESARLLYLDRVDDARAVFGGEPPQPGRARTAWKLGIANVLYYQRDLAGAEKLLREAMIEDPLLAEQAKAILLTVLVERGRYQEALALRPTKGWLSALSRLAVAGPLAEIRASSGKQDEVNGALADLDQATEEAMRRGSPVLALHARFAKGKILLQRGRAAEAKATLDGVADEGRQRGLVMFASMVKRLRSTEK
jgi:tetratricopeptide (TPR) repeat protein/TolB-like protein/tRNA A-37 threonylcarbamoyl transferase component Bud32